MTEKYIIDVDTGVDDAQALMLALSRPEIDVLAITCVAGNVGVDQVCLNTLKVLSICDRLDVPVYKGAGSPFVDEGMEATHYHGNDGLGDANLNIDVNMDKMQKESAVSVLLRLVNEYPGEITLVALAPLTNIAIALKQDQDFGKKLKRISIMGGNTQGRGNSSLCGEFNFACDPDAAYVVLNELYVPVTLFPWEINLTSAAGHPWEWFDKWIETDTPKGRFNKAATGIAVHKQRQEWFDKWIETDTHKGRFNKSATRIATQKQSLMNKSYDLYLTCDLNAIATVINPEIIQETKDVFATVELNGKYTRGMMILDWRGSLKKSPNVTLIEKIDTSLARSMFENMLK